MIKTINYKNQNSLNQIKKFLAKRREEENKNYKIVSQILHNIKKNRFKALRRYEIRFSKNKNIKINKKDINKKIKKLDSKVKKAIDYAYKRIKKFHLLQIRKIKNLKYVDKLKNKLEYKYLPIESVGIYVPGNLPSTLLMNAIPAKLAKVKKIILATPKVNGDLNELHESLKLEERKQQLSSV